MSAMAHERPHSFQEALKLAQKILSANHDLIRKNVIETEAEQLVIAAFRQSGGLPLTRMELFARMADRYPEAAGERLVVMSVSRAAGKPLQHLTGMQVFLSHEYLVGPDVLVPRPETEVLASIAIAELKPLANRPMLGLEIGIGSGVLSVELLSAYPALHIFASELTEAAEIRAYQNGRRILGPAGVQRLKIFRARHPRAVFEAFGDLLATRKADFLISNPPYLATGDEAEPEVCATEPGMALFAPEDDPLYFYRVIAENGPEFLKPEGLVFMEMAAERASEIEALFRERSWHTKVFQDLNQRDRVLLARR